MFLVNSRLGHFAATLSSSTGFRRFTLPGYLFSRSYEVFLPSSLARVLSRTLVSSTNLPVAVYGTVNIYSQLRSFSRQCGLNIFKARSPSFSRLSLSSYRISLITLPTRFYRLFRSSACLSSCVPPPFKQIYVSMGISTHFPSPTLFSLGLGSD